MKSVFSLFGLARRHAPAWPRPWRAVVVAASLSAMSALGHADTQTRTSAFDYDTATGLLKKQVIEPADSNLCVVTEHKYDDFGNIKETSTRNCNGSAGTFTGSGALINGEAAAPNTGTTAGLQAAFTSRTGSTQYTPDGRFVQSVTNAASQTETREYDPVLGLLNKLVGPNNLATQWAYDSFGRKLLEQRADGNGTKWTYEYCYTTNNPSGQASCPTVSGIAAVYVMTVTPVASANVSTPTSGTQNGAYTKTYYDALNRPIRVETQGFDGTSAIYQDTEYNAKGQVKRSSRPYYSSASTIAWTQYEYDQLGRPTKTTLADDSSTTVTYSGLTTTVTNAKSQQTKETLNEAGQVVTITDTNSKALSKTYDAVGNLLTTKDSLGNTIVLGYDSKGRKTSMQDPDMGSWTYAYNALGELVVQTDAKSQQTTMSYDVLGRMVKKSDATLVSNWYYDKDLSGATCGLGVGKLCEVTGSNAYDRLYHYDTYGRIDGVQTKPGVGVYSFLYSYDTNGRPLVTQYPTGQRIQNAYTSLGYLQQVSNAASGATYWRADSMDAEGHLTQQTTLNGVTTINGYDPLTGRLTSILAGIGNSSYVQQVAYHYDKVGNLDTVNDQATSASAVYAYDNLNRIQSETRLGLSVTSAQVVSWAIDEIGNINSRTDAVNSTTTSYAYGGARPHAITGAAGNINGLTQIAYSYDSNGSVTGASATGFTRTVTWTGANQVQAISQTLGSTTNALQFLYDPSGDRIQEKLIQNSAHKRTTIYLNPGSGAGLLYEEETTPTTTKKKHYLNAGGMTFGVMIYDTASANWTVQYWHKDQLGSTVAVTDAVGAVVERLAYEPYGKHRNVNGTTDVAGTLTAQTTRRGFTGHEMIDEMGLVNMNGRIYDPAIGRFLSADPHIQAPNNMQSYNRYSYVWNNPLNDVDPSGYFGLKDIGGAVNRAWKGMHRPLVQTWKAAWRDQVGRSIIVIAASIATQGAATSTLVGWSEFWASTSAGFVGGLAGSNGHLDAGVKGALTAAAFYGVGSATNMHGAAAINSASTGQIAANVAGHALVGCASAVASGGKCGQGALAAGVSATATNLGWVSLDNQVLGAAQSAVIGGTASMLGGGKFSNGAITGAFGYLFNHLTHEMRARLIGAGAFLGGTAGAVAAGGCTAGTGGVCALGAPTLVAGGMAAGAVTGEAIANAWDQLDNLLSKATGPGPQAVQYALVAERSGLYPTVGGSLVQLNAGDVWKYGISTDPAGRYPAQALGVLGLRMDIQTTGTLPQVYVAEKMQLINHAVSTGSLPPGNRIFK